MAASDAKAFVLLTEMVSEGYTIQFEIRGKGKPQQNYEVTVWKSPANQLDHHHYQGETLMEAVMKAYEKSGLSANK